ncbi:hypothetical protein JX580_06235 [Thiomicrospira microaerophila]|uniref:hypothetical protein n=1 Tax=Thiomicrospira microaerophila TaxID=406020 RepID=UPI00200BB52E|nr:hypothetical protein [Thiomicrospira microaerophila]UQB41299.1 hypothetical protein JX580_06235 [Thiomicrospira microaerophila]
MDKPRPPFTWHYYVMALGALAALMALTLGAWGSLVSAVGFAVLAHPVIRFSGPTRAVFLLIFATMYVFAFPDPEVVRAMMTSNG